MLHLVSHIKKKELVLYVTIFYWNFVKFNILIISGSLDVKRKERRRDRQHDYTNLRKSLFVGYASQLAERMLRHNGYKTLGFKSQLVQVRNNNIIRSIFDFTIVYMTVI